jgi:hypothetical protein
MAYSTETVEPKRRQMKQSRTELIKIGLTGSITAGITEIEQIRLTIIFIVDQLLLP